MEESATQLRLRSLVNSQKVDQASLKRHWSRYYHTPKEGGASKSSPRPAIHSLGSRQRPKLSSALRRRCTSPPRTRLRPSCSCVCVFCLLCVLGMALTNKLNIVSSNIAISFQFHILNHTYFIPLPCLRRCMMPL